MTMWTDEIVNETRATRDAMARKHGYDVDAIFSKLMDRQTHEERSVVSFPPKTVPASPETTAG